MTPAFTDTIATTPASCGPATFGQAFAVCVLAFLTVVDLFAAQALLPSLTQKYAVTPAAMSLAVNSCTLGMAIAGLAVAVFGRHLDKQIGAVGSLALLSIPTVLLAFAPGLGTFALLRIVQGLLMVTAFSLTLAFLGERYGTKAGAAVFSAYVTGNVASNLVGRLISAAVLDHAGLTAAFYVFAVLNVAGAFLAYSVLAPPPGPKPMPAENHAPAMAAWKGHLRNPELRAAFCIGFCILFAFIGTFTFVNFVLVRPPLSVTMMGLGTIYFVFLPSIVTTPLAGGASNFLGTRPALWLSFATALGGLPLLVSSSLLAVLAGLTAVAIGTFFAQALATGFVGRAAKTNQSAASGMYLAAYFSGGIVGTAVLGQIFDNLGWAATVMVIGLSLVVAALIVFRLERPERPNLETPTS